MGLAGCNPSDWAQPAARSCPEEFRPEGSTQSYRDRDWKTRADAVEQRMPTLRTGSNSSGPSWAATDGREGAEGGDPEGLCSGHSDLSVDDLVKALGLSGICDSQVSRLFEEINGKVKTFLDRPVVGDWPCLRIDAIGLKVRQVASYPSPPSSRLASTPMVAGRFWNGNRHFRRRTKLDRVPAQFDPARLATGD